MTITARWNGETLARSDDTLVVEGNHYFPAGDVMRGVLAPSETTSHCGWKGTANYYSVHVGSKTFENTVWFYPDPIPECPKIKNLLCFFNEKVDAILVDGVEISKVPSPWSDD